ncbi:histidine phosphatase family protein [Paenibacillus puerhi]|uniref:histidine phosphatase family protein n=1 Tax=Paenibacillus puerhi TaxID=2692622 RepID=UPI00135A7DF6|nr:histidine phosphatase family protein [Paenibacillus puerhi]
MKIGLVRHFKVKKGFPSKGWLTRDELVQWFKEYDEADIEPVATDLQAIAWKSCHASDMPRALRTAELLYHGEIRATAKLREIPLPRFRRNWRLPFLLWAIAVRLSPYLDPKVKEEIKQTKERINHVLDDILLQGEEEMLLVSHAGLMMLMRQELLKRGFRGPRFRTPENGKLYVYEKRPQA